MTRKQNSYFQKIAKSYFNDYMERFPEYGSFLGLRKYDGLWSKESLQAYLDNIKFFKEYLKKFQKIRQAGLTEAENLDKKIAVSDIKLAIFYLDRLRMWQSDPDISDGIGSLLFVLLGREPAPSKKLLKSINKSLQGIPLLAKEAKTRVVKPYKLWTKMAIESCQSLRIFLKNLRNLKYRENNFLKNIDLAVLAIDDYEEFLKNILSKSLDKYSIGRENFNQLIKIRELGLGSNEMIEIGQRALEADKQELKEIAKDMGFGKVESAGKKINKKHLKNFKEIIKQYQRIVAKARDFIISHNLMDVPANEKVIVKETPSFLADTTPFAAYFAPPKFCKEQLGLYVVTPSKNKKLLEKHNYTGIFNTSVHEAYPGHHLQFAKGLRNPSLIRALSGATEMVEGWAFYCEEYMRDVGFNNTAETRFVQTSDEIWRAARVLIDIKLHSGGMTFNQAVNFLIKQTNMEKSDAMAEAKRYTKSPSYQLSYLIGKYLIKKLKRDVQEKMGERYSDKFFHETILKAGSVPIKHLKEEFELKIRDLTPTPNEG